MKIKRFEAPNMSEALRMIKKEFGEDAVILSAKTTKKAGGVLGGKWSRQVVVTAAIDTSQLEPPGQAMSWEDPSITADRSAGQEFSTANGSSGQMPRLLQRYMPITRTGQQKLRSKFLHIAPDSQKSIENEVDRELEIREHLESQGVASGLVGDLAQKITALLPSDPSGEDEIRFALSQVIEAMGMIAPSATAGRNPGVKPRIMVLVGPHGAGKTTTIAKLAANALLHEQQKVALLTIDNQRIAGAAELARYAQIMGIDLRQPHDCREVREVLHSITHADLIVVDTPGLAPNDVAGRTRLKNLLADLKGAEVHLVLSATVQESILCKFADFFAPLGINRLLFTKIDWAHSFGHLINMIIDAHLPAAYLADSPQVPEGLKPATSQAMANLIWAGGILTDGQMTVNLVQRHRPAQQIHEYVANRNSDIFHHKDCQSVRRINSENMVAFKDPADAREQNFKPCRMCCTQLIVSKPIERLASSRMASSR